MTPKLYDVFAASVRFGKVSYPRPCVIIGIAKDNFFAVVALSSAMDLYRGPPIHFRIEPDASGFTATGLIKESFVSSHPIQHIGIDALIRRRGQLEGDLLKRFLNWI